MRLRSSLAAGALALASVGTTLPAIAAEPAGTQLEPARIVTAEGELGDEVTAAEVLALEALPPEAGGASPSQPTATAPAGEADERVTAQAAPAYDAVIDLTFPVAGPTSYSDWYHAARDGGARVHKATDIMAAYGQIVHAAMGGTVSFITGQTGPVPSYGYMITVAGDDGRSYSYLHLGRQDRGPTSAYLPGIVRGTRVQRGQPIAIVGCSGNASCSAPHLHFEVEDRAIVDPYGTHRRNPYRSLRAAQQRGDVPGASGGGGLGEPVRACVPEGDPDAGDVWRIKGADRVATAIAVSRWYWRTADVAVLAAADDFPDALAAGAVAARYDAPLLLTDPARLSSAVGPRLREMGVSRVYVMGGPASVSRRVLDDIARLGITTTRVAGEDRYATAAAAARRAGAPAREVTLALGAHPEPSRAWPDAVAAGALVGTPARMPTLLTRQTSLPRPTAETLRELGVRTVWLVGGTAAVSRDVEQAVSRLGITVRRLQGESRYGTSAAAAAEARRRLSGTADIVVASGANYPDALAGAALTARRNASLLLVPPCALEQSREAQQYLSTAAGQYRHVVLLGDVAAISERVRWQIGRLFPTS